MVPVKLVPKQSVIILCIINIEKFGEFRVNVPNNSLLNQNERNLSWIMKVRSCFVDREQRSNVQKEALLLFLLGEREGIIAWLKFVTKIKKTIANKKRERSNKKCLWNKICDRSNNKCSGTKFVPNWANMLKKEQWSRMKIVLKVTKSLFYLFLTHFTAICGVT